MAHVAGLALSTSGRRFHFLLAALLAQIVISPFLTGEGSGIVQDLFFLGLLLASVQGVRDSRLYRLILVLAGLSVLGVVGRHAMGSWAWEAASDLSGAAVILLTSVEVARYLSRQRRVNLDTVLGGLCVYLFMGAMWFLLYSLVERATPGAFAFTVHGDHLSPEMIDRLLFYFSYITLLTTGYGDIVPLTPPVQVMAMLEGLLGQFYLVFFMARLVGLHVAYKEEHKAG